MKTSNYSLIDKRCIVYEFQIDMKQLFNLGIMFFEIFTAFSTEITLTLKFD